MARTPSPARETRALPGIPLKQPTPRLNAGSELVVLVFEQDPTNLRLPICISPPPAALDRYPRGIPAMSLIAFAPLYLGCARSTRPLPRGFTGHVAHPIRSIPIADFEQT
jgi:hypothetical protein